MRSKLSQVTRQLFILKYFSHFTTSRSQLEEEIYTEICANTNVRVLNTVESYNQAMLPLGTQSSANNSSIALSTR